MLSWTWSWSMSFICNFMAVLARQPVRIFWNCTKIHLKIDRRILRFGYQRQTYCIMHIRLANQAVALKFHSFTMISRIKVTPCLSVFQSLICTISSDFLALGTFHINTVTGFFLQIMSNHKHANCLTIWLIDFKKTCFWITLIVLY